MKLPSFVSALAAITMAQDAVAVPSAFNASALHDALVVPKGDIRHGNSTAPRQPVCNVESAIRHANGANIALGFGVPAGLWFGAAAGALAGATYNDRQPRILRNAKGFTFAGAAAGAAVGVVPAGVAMLVEFVLSGKACPNDLLPQAANPMNCSKPDLDPNPLAPQESFQPPGITSALFLGFGGLVGGHVLDKRSGPASSPRSSTMGASLGAALGHAGIGSFFGVRNLPRPRIQTECAETAVVPA